jgi:glycosyltransferase involved in cell wall biosynthesis
LKGDINLPIVSIVCITYNHEEFISEAIDSFLAQKTKFPFEIIIGDDFSADDTVKVVKKYTRQYPTIIKLIARGENIGMGANLVDCFNRCKGEYIAICEGDDYWITSKKLQTQVDLMTQYPDINISFHPAYAVENCELKRNKIFSNYGNKIKKFSLDEVILGGGGFMPTQSLILRADILKNAPDWFYKYPIDYFIQILGSIGHGVLYIPSVFSAYRINVKGSWSARQRNISVQKIKENLNREKKSLLNLKEIGVSENVINKAIAISTFKAFTRKYRIHELVRSLSIQSKYIGSKKILTIISLFFLPFIKFINKIGK